MVNVYWLLFSVSAIPTPDFYALGSEEIFLGLKDIFRCRRRSVVPHHRQCKGNILSLRFTNFFPTFLHLGRSPPCVTCVMGQECH
jgi:hypothetical protein